MVHKPCMAMWLFTNNHFPLLLDFANNPKNIVFSVLHSKKEPGSFTGGELWRLSLLLTWLGRQPVLLVFFFPKVKCSLVGTAWVFSIGLSCWWLFQGPWRRHSPAGCDGVPCLWNGRTMALQGFVLLTSSSEEGPYRSANHLLDLLLIIDIFIHCHKQEGSSMVMVGSADLYVGGRTLT